MRNILMEMHLAESFAQHIPKDSIHFLLKNEDSLRQFNADILHRYSVTEKEFATALNYYKTQGETLDSIYQDLLNELSVRQARLK
jgi:hypothetical protein